MSAHLSHELVERFHAQQLASGDRGVIYDHIVGCETCRRKVVDAETATVAVDAVTAHLLPREGDEPYHLDPETIEAFVDDQLDSSDRGLAKLHLEDCASCAAEVEDLRESLATMKAASRSNETTPPIAVVSRFARFSMPTRIAAVIAFASFVMIALFVIWKLRSTGPGQTPVGGRDVTVQTQPTPVPSSQASVPGPTPSLGPSPNVAENGSKETRSPGNETIVALKDGQNQIALDKSGNVSGVDSLPPESRIAVKDALEGEQLQRPEVLNEVASAQVSERAPNETEERIRVVYPAAAMIAETQPKLRWVASKTAAGYRIEIADEGFHQVAKSPDLAATTLTWSPTSPLKRGMTYTWTIRAVNKSGDLSSVTSQRKFKILADDRNARLVRLKHASKSHLARGLFYAREGMTADAIREFRILRQQNPSSQIVRKLLSEVESWQPK